MKLIRCLIEVEHLDRLVNALVHVTSGMTVWEARKDSKETNYTAFYRGLKYEVSPPRLVVEIVSDDTWVDEILRALLELHKAAPFGDKDVRVYPVEASYHVRTGFIDI
jgi:nitrogen regulatory protein PII